MILRFSAFATTFVTLALAFRALGAAVVARPGAFAIAFAVVTPRQTDLFRGTTHAICYLYDVWQAAAVVIASSSPYRKCIHARLPIIAGHLSGGPQKYHVKSLTEIRRKRLAMGHQPELDAILGRCGCSGALVESPPNSKM